MPKKIDATGVITFDDPHAQAAFKLAKGIAISLSKSRERIADAAKGHGPFTGVGVGASRLGECKLSYELLRDGYTIAIEHFKAVAPVRGVIGWTETVEALTLLTKLSLGRE